MHEELGCLKIVKTDDAVEADVDGKDKVGWRGGGKREGQWEVLRVYYEEVGCLSRG